jgi:hypothetical protein
MLPSAALARRANLYLGRDESGRIGLLAVAYSMPRVGFAGVGRSISRKEDIRVVLPADL